jgi:hypothetical protein
MNAFMTRYDGREPAAIAGHRTRTIAVLKHPDRTAGR